MRIGFDAKRAFYNQSGLGNYSRNLLSALYSRYPDNRYILYTPGIKKDLFHLGGRSFELRMPAKTFHRAFPSFWRTFAISGEIKKDKLDIYHGLSHELPAGIENTGVKSVVTIHDLIFIRYPALYSAIDRSIYMKKFQSACKKADRIISVSRQTADDIIEFFGINPSRIDVIYQNCNPLFMKNADDNQKQFIRHKHRLPDHYILNVGNLEERKNSLTLIKAVHSANIDMPVVIIGKRTKYYQQVKKYIDDNRLTNIHIHDTISNEELPFIYQMADIFVYPSLFEGFGIPIIESLFSRTPVITSIGGCFAEAGGPDSIYVNSRDHEELGAAIKKVLSDEDLRKQMIESGYHYAKNFTPEKTADSVMQVYKKVVTQ
ncbi:MAG TPA: glycosyltransferase family 1 protein [Bacteroidales bacterium]|nr:glycosyltransferase family 1 protein [Bacteroidales bacterium]